MSPEPLTLALVLDTALLPPTDSPLSSLRELATSAERAGITALILKDSLAETAETGGTGETGEATQGLDATIVAAALGPVTSSIGLIPELPTAVTEPFHTATALQTIDFASLGRAGLLLSPATDAAQHAAHGRWEQPDSATIFEDAADTVEAINRLWESWEPDAEIRDAATGRFLDRKRIHNAAFEGHHFSVEGASITPRSPQGRPPVVIRVADLPSAALAGQRADIALLAPGVALHDDAWPGVVRGLAHAVLAEAAGEGSAWASEAAPRLWLELPTGSGATEGASAITELGDVHVSALVLRPTASQLTPQGLASLADAVRPASATDASITLRSALGLPAALNPFTLARQEA